jgi:cytochrome c553
MMLLCVVLVFVATMAEATHIHAESTQPHSKNTHASCVFCHVAHSPVLPAEAQRCPAPIETEQQTYSLQPLLYSHLDALSLYVRPPPVI